ncbi:MAG: cupin domain-containing protein [Nitrospirota bacterium]
MKKILISFVMLGLVTSTTAQQAPKVSPVVKATVTATGQKLQYPQTDKPEIESVLIEIAPGGESGRHMHPVTTYVYVLEGTLTVEMDQESPREYAAGSGFLESVNTWHNGKNLGKAPVKVLVVFVSEEGKKNFIRAEGQPKV